MTQLPLLTRQPIFNAQLQVNSYQLLCHNQSTDGAQQLFNAMDQQQLESLVGQLPAYVPYSPRLLDNPAPCSRRQLVVEIHNATQINATQLHAIKQLRERGYTIALSDFELTLDSEGLLAYADVITMDVRRLKPQQIQQDIEHLKLFGMQLVVSHISSHKLFAQCKALGFDFFQGSFFTRPDLGLEHQLTLQQQATLELLCALHDTNAPVDKIERMIASDHALSHKLLRLVNSVALGLNREVESLRQAIMLLGFNKLRHWINLLVMSNLGGKSPELLATALCRGRLCELLAQHSNSNSLQNRSDNSYAVGFLSVLDAFVDIPMEELLAQLPLNESLKQIIRQTVQQPTSASAQSGEAWLLEVACQHERGNWSQIDWNKLENLGIDGDTLADLYAEALHWVNKAIRSSDMNDSAALPA